MPRVQYSLASLFELTLGFAAFLSSLAVSLHKGSPVDPRVVWVIGWLILCTVYRRQRARGVMLLNGVGAIVLGPYFVLSWLLWSSRGIFGLEVPPHVLAHFGTAVGLACFGGTLVSFPAFVVWFFSPRRPTEDAGRGRQQE